MSELTFQDPKKKFCEELRAAREYKGLDLARVSEKSKIALNYLEKMEAGEWDFLPHAYVRSFLRTYALIVGLEVGKVLEQFDNIVDEPPVPVPGVYDSEDSPLQRDLKAKKPVKKKKKTDEPEEIRKPLKFTLAGDTVPPRSPSHSITPVSNRGLPTWYILGGLVLLVVLVIVFWPRGESSSNVEEIPFDEVVQEHQRDTGQLAQDTPSRKVTPPVRTSTPIVEPERQRQEQVAEADAGEESDGSVTLDSEEAEPFTEVAPGRPLLLHAEALQRCYLKVTVDSDTIPLSDIVLETGMRRVYEADSLFTVVLGNAAGMKLTLGSTDLGVLGEEGRVVTIYIDEMGVRRVRRGVLGSTGAQPPRLDSIDLTRPVGQARGGATLRPDTLGTRPAEADTAETDSPATESSETE